LGSGQNETKNSNSTAANHEASSSTTEISITGTAANERYENGNASVSASSAAQTSPPPAAAGGDGGDFYPNDILSENHGALVPLADSADAEASTVESPAANATSISSDSGSGSGNATSISTTIGN